jgi:hypothetical protein
MLITKIYARLLQSKTPFSLGSVGALACNIGGAVIVLGDISWLVFDMLHDFRWYHPIIMSLLIVGTSIMSYAFVWIHKSIATKLTVSPIITAKSCNCRIDELEARIGQLQFHVDSIDRLTQIK